MKTCPKCGYDKLADTARFCHKCGCDCAAVQVERTSAAEEPEAAPLVGDKNLINESTIIGKQEKYEASNITIHNNITEDHSHTTIVCAVSGKRIYLDHSVVCPKCGKQVALEYYVEASKRCENCEQQAREEYRAFVVRTTGAGPLDAACKQQLDAEAQRLQIDAATQASILRARQQKPAGKSAELTSVQRAELEAAVSRLITATEPEPAQKSLEALTVLHDRTLYDYPSYAGSYERAAASIEAYLAEYPDIALVLDVHRDAIGDESTVYKTCAAGSGMAQVMLVCGTDEYLEHPLWRENLKLALAMQAAAVSANGALMRPIHLAPERYNQQYTTGSLIIEVGTNGNTLSEALAAAELFGRAAGEMLASLAASG